MDTKTKWILFIILALALIVIGTYFLWTSQSEKQSRLDAFAACISESGAEFYGAFWCPHCQDQKAMFGTLFGSAVEKLNYIECSASNARDQLEICRQANIKVYPTWRFADGTEETGLLSLNRLSEKTQCPMPN